VKTILIFVLTGALLGIVVASLVVPPALAWYTAPGGLPQGAQIQALVQIPEVIRYSTGRLIRAPKASRAADCGRWRRRSRRRARIAGRGGSASGSIPEPRPSRS
jgi:hypothetical protein